MGVTGEIAVPKYRAPNIRYSCALETTVTVNQSILMVTVMQREHLLSSSSGYATTMPFGSHMGGICSLSAHQAKSTNNAAIISHFVFDFFVYLHWLHAYTEGAFSNDFIVLPSGNVHGMHCTVDHSVFSFPSKDGGRAQ